MGCERQTEDRLWQQLVEVADVAGGPSNGGGELRRLRCHLSYW